MQGKQSISLEPGGQFELSGAPLETLHQTCAEVNSHLYQVNSLKLFSILCAIACRKTLLC
jgi:gamma-glutamylcysteine synthetase